MREREREEKIKRYTVQADKNPKIKFIHLKFSTIEESILRVYDIIIATILK
jgi:hypothetical protein